MLAPKALLFDLDGTILDTKDFILSAFEHSLLYHGFPIPSREIIAKYVGLPFDQCYYHLTKEVDTKRFHAAHRDFQIKNPHLCNLFPKAKETLDVLKNKGYKMGVVTSRYKITVVESLRRVGLENFFDVVIFGNDFVNLKPHPEPVLKAIEKINVTPIESVMIGDTDTDIEAGKNAGTKTVRATYGLNTERLYETEPDIIIDNISDILKFF
jgi:pyrophosphatase PpaX